MNLFTESEDKKNRHKLTKTEINKLLSDYESMGYDEEWAKDDLIDLVDFLNKIGNPLTLYRIICVDDINDINKEYIGSHYSLDKNNLITNHYRRDSIHGSCFGDKVFLLTISSNKSQIDVMETLSNNILFPHEEEITLKNKGRGSSILSIEEL